MKAWHTLSSDIFYWNNTDYLLVTDYHSTFPVMKKLPNTQSTTVIAHLKSIIDEHDMLQTVVSSTRLVPFKNSVAAMGSPMSSQACCTLSRMILLKGRYKL